MSYLPLRLSVLLACLLLICPTLAQPASPSPVMPAVTERFAADLGALRKFYDLPMDPASRDRLDRFYAERLAELDAMDYESLAVADRDRLAPAAERDPVASARAGL